MTGSIFMVRVPVDARHLYRFARRSHLPAQHFDEGYAVHALLAALFDHGAAASARVAPKPFALDPTVRVAAGRNLVVLGYSGIDHRGLADRARTFADPLASDACDLDELTSRPMPTAFAAGTRLGFRLRACCVRRVAKRGNQRAERAEVDAFLAKSWEVDDPGTVLARQEVYGAWLAAELSKGNACRLLHAHVASWRLARVYRRTQGSSRHGTRIAQPDVRFDGELEVTDPAAFAALLARGVGRQRAFGYGMLLLRPPRG